MITERRTVYQREGREDSGTQRVQDGMEEENEILRRREVREWAYNKSVFGPMYLAEYFTLREAEVVCCWKTRKIPQLQGAWDD